MIEQAIEVKNLSKSFGRKKVLEGLCFAVPYNSVVGFLGPNGAGKTTTMRILLGLIPSFKGEIKLLGHEIPKRRVNALEQIGAMVENPSFIEGMTAAENLKWFGKLRGPIPKNRIEEVLEMTGLKEAANRRFGVFSSGMKQRLGIAFGILHRPRLLLLDEPSSGLDPAGRVQMREILRNIHEVDGTTIFLSSHLLDEVQRMCDFAVIISGGRTVAQGFVGELLRQQQEEFEVRVAERQWEAARGALEAMGGLVLGVELSPRGLRVRIEAGRGAELNRRLVEAGFEVEGLIPVEASLEERFMQLTGAEAVAEAGPAQEQEGEAVLEQPAEPLEEPVGAEPSVEAEEEPSGEAEN
jgi:ABC-2 type transport system ATP-binding protein